MGKIDVVQMDFLRNPRHFADICILRRLVASDAMINGHPAIVNGHLLGGAL